MSNYFVYPTAESVIVNISVNDGPYRELDAAMCRYKISSQKSPLYNYANQQFVATADGACIVTGVLGLNFLFQGYLWSIIDTLRTPSTSVATAQVPAAAGVFARAVELGSTPPSYDSYYKNVVMHNIPGVSLAVMILTEYNMVSSCVFTNIRFLDVEIAVDAKSGDPILELFTFMGNLGKPQYSGPTK